MKHYLKRTILAAFVITGVISCSKNKDSVDPGLTELTQDPEKVLQYIKSMGFPESSIVDNGSEYIVEEDISFPKNMKVPAITNAPRTEQYYTGSIVDSTNRKNIRIYVDTSMTVMKKEVDSAIAQWNRVSGSTLRFKTVTAAPYDILVKNEKLAAPPGYTTCGMAEFPTNGKAGTLVRINKAAITGNSFAQRSRTICHELGHCISFRHTNWSARGEVTATNVPGVTGTDALSLMNGGQCGIGATVLSQKDKDATAALY
jgi:hypothetical protein